MNFDLFKNLNYLDLFQNLSLFTFLKIATIIFLVGFIIFQIILARQIRSMEKIIIQPASSAILNLISLIFIALGGVVLFVILQIKL